MLTHAIYITIILLLILFRNKINFHPVVYDVFFCMALIFILVYLLNYFEVTKNEKVIEFVNTLFIALKIMMLFITVVVVLLAIIGFWGKRYSLRVDNFNIGGINVLFDRSNEIFIRAVGGLLETKRSIFEFDKKVDNIYEVFNSYYDIYKYLRDNIELLDSEKDAELYTITIKMIHDLNGFLTKHQNDYRRWYDKVSNENIVYIYDVANNKYKNENFKFHEATIEVVQEQYYRYVELISDFQKINSDFKDPRIMTNFKLENTVWRENNNA